jgi:hypothetical protein
MSAPGALFRKNSVRMFCVSYRSFIGSSGRRKLDSSLLLCILDEHDVISPMVKPILSRMHNKNEVGNWTVPIESVMFYETAKCCRFCSADCSAAFCSAIIDTFADWFKDVLTNGKRRAFDVWTIHLLFTYKCTSVCYIRAIREAS